ncbi:MAG: flagellar basal-body MS-ring/collar protein FliF [bacterium]|nr:flagellar basal-body MS-ring/collar protein FliF [bacterium]
MNDFIRQIQQDLGRIWTSLNRVQQLLFMGVAAACVVAILAVVMWAQTPEWTPLFTNLEEADAGQVVAKLRDAKVPYQIVGNAILVPKTKVDEQRLSLAGQGIPTGDSIGYEIFDKNQFGMTDALQRLNYQRALQGELTRTIEAMEGVEDCRVHIVIPEKDLFSEDNESPTAAVVLKLDRGAKLSPDQAKTVIHLVSKSVPGLKATDVAITDVAGRNYTEELNLEKNESDLTLQQLQIKKKLETNLKRNLQTTLDRVLGPNNSVVTVAAELDFSSVETNEETYSPVVDASGSESGIMRSVKETSETYGGGRPEAGGVPGVTTNLADGANAGAPGYQTADASNRNGLYEKRESIRNYEDNKRIQRRVKAPGEVKRLSVAVVINGELEEEQLASFKELVGGAAGIDPVRGDTVVVTSQKFNDQQLKVAAEEETQARQQANIQGYLRVLGAIMVGVLALFLLRRGFSSTQEPIAEEIGPLSLTEEVVETVRDPVAPTLSLGAVGEDDRKSTLAREITKVIKAQPTEIAKLVRSWMLEDE